MRKFFVAVLLLVSGLLQMTGASNIRVENHGYVDVVVAISSRVPENKKLLAKLESLLTKGSAVLFRATKRHLYFKEFIVEIPENWKAKAAYRNARDMELASNIRVEVSDDNTPFVKQPGNCGEEGRYMQITPTYILDDIVKRDYGPPGNVITHEWGHFRWGLFDEYPTSLDPASRFYPVGKQWHPTRCSTKVTGEVRPARPGGVCKFDDDWGMMEDCYFMPDDGAVSSLMYMQFIESLTEFCDHPENVPEELAHNRLAPNLQNNLCHRKSAWEVMRQHSDFHDLSTSTPLPDSTDTTPRFRYVQKQPRKRVLVLDTSGSMEGEAMNVLRQAASNYILTTIETGSQLGVVSFSKKPAVLSPLLKIRNDTDRERLVGMLPSLADGGTSIGAGLKAGIRVLSRGKLIGGSIILITDGKENEEPMIAETIPQLKRKGIMVHAISYGQEAEQAIKNLSLVTGGKRFFYNMNANSTALLDGFAATIGPRDSLDRNLPLSILTDTRIVEAGDKAPSSSTGTFYIDSTIGKETSLTFSYTEPISVGIRSPSGPYTPKSIKDYYTSRLPAKVLIVKLGNDLTPGLWSYHVTTNASTSAITVNVQSKPRHEDADVFQIDSWISQKSDVAFRANLTFGVYATVSRGSLPVSGASVDAIVEGPVSTTFLLSLLDNGVGPDIIKGDGIYSASIIASDLHGNGRYNIKINVLGAKAKVKAGVGPQAAEHGAPGRDRSAITSKPFEDFQRVTTAGEFRLQNFFRSAKDELPPARITDFRATSFDYSTVKATLVWTAVGGNMERGRASRYVIYLRNDPDVAVTSSNRLPKVDVIRGDLNSTLTSGDLETFVVLVRALDKPGSGEHATTVYLSVAAVDEAGNEGRPSNLLTLSKAVGVSVRMAPHSDDDSSSSTVLIISVVVAIVIFILIIIVIIIIWYKKGRQIRTYWVQRKRRKMAKESKEGQGDMMV